ncbi:MAG: hypothetical protein A2X64_00625 [Ignavibacteria bacterium GWF2_33_9]|nr:MAG: hypothetical protein A2X64_00625 [Ignavibacteria bacterium GWF2_33_9]
MKLYFKDILTIIFILIVSGQILSAAPEYQCPYGYVKIEKDVTINVGGTYCQYHIYLCVLCPAGPAAPQFTIKLVQFEPSPINCGFNPSDAKDAIELLILNPTWISQNIATDCFAGWGPCPENAVILYGVVPKCWSKVGYRDDENIWRVTIIACDPIENCDCTTVYSVCWDPQLQDFTKTIISYPNNYNCCPFTEIPADPEENDETPTGCFYLPCSQ